jgi:hypothetical protein
MAADAAAIRRSAVWGGLLQCSFTGDTGRASMFKICNIMMMPLLKMAIILYFSIYSYYMLFQQTHQ